jgi:hypothetical protein
MLADNPPVLADHDAIRIGVRVEFVAGKSIQGFRWSEVAAVDQKRAPHLPLETAVAERGFRRPQPQITAPGRYF